MELRGKVLVAQGGGPTAVINQSFVGVVKEARKYSQVTGIYGALHGLAGIVEEDFVDLTKETEHNLEFIAQTPSSGLLSTRDKPDAAYCREIFKVLKAHDVRFFFYIGGNDSASTVSIINDEAKKSSYDFRAIHIPKTIDNDLMLNDHTPGYGSAARFVAQAFMGTNLDNRALPGVYIGIVMGRHAGYLVGATALARKYEDDGPHLIYFPESPFDQDKFLADVKRVFEKHGRCVIAVSEGIQDKNGVPITVKLNENEVEKDAHGNVQLSGSGSLGDLLSQLIKDNLNIKRVRADTLGYLQRSFAGCVSDTDQIEAREVGERAVQFAIGDNLDGSVAIVRTGDYSVDYQLVELKEVAAKTRLMPKEFINAEGNNVTDAFIKYVTPLVGSGLPEAYRIRAPKVPKILNK
ncbi:MAG: 6-phosphofructokinase [Candidatus Cloacimonas sp.]|nr:6-phosphofructokinase [Candidatus Cloacimonadota bacterium]